MEEVYQTERPLLRPLVPADVQLLFDLDSDPEVMRYINGGQTSSMEYIVECAIPCMLSYLRDTGRPAFWIAIEKASMAFIGWFHLRSWESNPEYLELGYRLRRTYWGKGLATEGCKRLLSVGFYDRACPRIVALVMPENRASTRVMEKIGLSYDHDFLYQPLDADTPPIPLVVYALDRAQDPRADV